MSHSNEECYKQLCGFLEHVEMHEIPHLVIGAIRHMDAVRINLNIILPSSEKVTPLYVQKLNRVIELMPYDYTSGVNKRMDVYWGPGRNLGNVKGEPKISEGWVKVSSAPSFHTLERIRLMEFYQ